MTGVVSIFVLTREQILLHARQQADAGEPCAHGYEPGTAHACTWERAYVERKRELDALASEVI